MSFNQIFSAVEEHFEEALLDELDLTQRFFPSRVLPDLQLALEQLPDFGFTVRHFFAATQGHLPVMQFAQIYDRNPMMPVLAGAPEYLDIDFGDDHPVRCLSHGLWLIETSGRRCAVLFSLLPNSAAHGQCHGFFPQGTDATFRTVRPGARRRCDRLA